MSDHKPSNAALRAAEAILFKEHARWGIHSAPGEQLKVVAQTIDRETGVKELVEAAKDAVDVIMHGEFKYARLNGILNPDEANKFADNHPVVAKLKQALRNAEGKGFPYDK